MSQESDTPNDSKPVRLKLSKKEANPSPEPEPENTAPAPEPPVEKAPAEPKAISFKKREEADPEASSPGKKQIPLKRKKPKADPLPDPDV